MIISYCLETLLRHKDIDAVQVVAGTMWQDAIKTDIQDISRRIFLERNTDGIADAMLYAQSMLHPVLQKSFNFSRPGISKVLSVMNGLQDIQTYASEEDIVLIHDADRPNLSPAQISRCIEACRSHDAAIPAMPITNTVYVSNQADTISTILPKQRLFVGQTPVTIRLGRYMSAAQRLTVPELRKLIDIAEPATLARLDIAMIPGEETNYAITSKEELERFSKERAADSSRPKVAVFRQQ